MEFFQEVHAPDFDVQQLKNLATISNLPMLCTSIDNIISEKGDEADIYCLWGEFNVSRLEIRHGVRFSLLNCPHALAWTLTYKEADQTIIIHCTIDSADENTEPDFAESINVFINDWSEGITKSISD
jgi:hypothetical protein